VNILVTGGAGFIGSNLVDYLIEKNDCVLTLDNLSTGKLENINKKAVFFNHDIRNDFSNENIIKKHSPQVIFHLAALARIRPSFENPNDVLETNFKGTLNVLEYAKTYKSKVIFAGSSSVLFNIYANPYAHSKFLGEQLCKMYNHVFGVSVGIARFYNVYGNRHLRNGIYANVLGVFEKQIINKEPLTINGNGKQRRDFTHVLDVCDALYKMKDRFWDATVFDIGRGCNYSINEVAQMYNAKNITYHPAGSGEALETLADNQNTKKILNWEPKRNLPDYIDNFLSSI